MLRRAAFVLGDRSELAPGRLDDPARQTSRSTGDPGHPTIIVDALAALALAASLAACGSKDPPPQRFDGGPPRRVIEPPSHDVRALPPYALSAVGVGPYKLGTPLTQIMNSLPPPPRMTLLQIPTMVDHATLRDEGLLIGGERQGDASYIAVLQKGIARAAEGAGVGSTTAELEHAVGPAVDDPAVALDPGLWRGRGLPGAHFVMDGGHAIAVLLEPAPPPPIHARPAPPPAAGSGTAAVAIDAGVPACVRTPAPAGAYAGVAPGDLRFAPACLGVADGVAWSGDIVVVAASGGEDVRPRRIAALELRGLRWVAPVRVDDDHDELVAVTEARREDSLVYSVIGLRLEGTHLLRVAEADVYRTDAQTLAWMNVSLADIELRLEITSDLDSLLVGGVLVHRIGGQVRTVAPLQVVTVRRRHGGEAGDVERDDRVRTEESDGGPGPERHDAARDGSAHVE